MSDFIRFVREEDGLFFLCDTNGKFSMPLQRFMRILKEKIATGKTKTNIIPQFADYHGREGLLSLSTARKLTSAKWTGKPQSISNRDWTTDTCARCGNSLSMSKRFRFSESASNSMREMKTATNPTCCTKKYCDYRAARLPQSRADFCELTCVF